MLYIWIDGARDSTSDVHASHLSEPSGQYIYVTGKGQLTGSFEQIASYVLRLSS